MQIDWNYVEQRMEELCSLDMDMSCYCALGYSRRR